MKGVNEWKKRGALSDERIEEIVDRQLAAQYTKFTKMFKVVLEMDYWKNLYIGFRISSVVSLYFCTV